MIVGKYYRHPHSLDVDIRPVRLLWDGAIDSDIIVEFWWVLQHNHYMRLGRRTDFAPLKKLKGFKELP